MNVESAPYPEWFEGINVIPNPPIAFISKLVVDKSCQGLGIGDFLDEKAILKAKFDGAGSVLCDVPDLGITFPKTYFGAMYMELKRS
jgi:hypothetical protein